MNIRRILSVLLCVLMLFGSVAPTVFADEQPACEITAQTQAIDESLQPTQTAADESEDALNYVLLGDSIAKGSGIVNSEEACYGRIIADTNGYNFVNYGVDGLKSGELLSMLKRNDVLESVKNADIVNITIGGNNFLHGNIPLLLLGVLLHIDSVLFSPLEQIILDFLLVL